jgi:serine/threonine-protein kinase
MEYLEGECLEDRIARQGCISVAETSRVARHVSRALSRAHSRGIVHRDLKPANIFITHSEDEEDGDDWTAKVLDFGIAKMDDFGDRSTTKTGTVLGTPLFMSPEQVRGASAVDSRADLYSFGMVIYNMLTGTYAFEGQSFGDLLVSICTDPLPELSRSAPQAPPALNTWFQKVCARDPDDRYQTADEAMHALSEAIGDTSPSTRMSMVDITSASDNLVPLAATYAASSDIAESGSRQVDTASSGTDVAASALTISEPPKRPSFPYLIGGAAVVVALGVFLFTRGGDDQPEVDPSGEPVSAAQPAQQPEAVDEPEAPPEEPAPVDEKPIDQADQPAEEKTDDAAAKEEATPAPPKPRIWKPRPTPQPAATSPAPAPKPKPKPSALDLGF